MAGGIPLASSFNVTAGLPLDQRQVVADLTARDLIDSGVRWQGMIVYVISTQLYYLLAGGTANANWTVLSGTPPGTTPIKTTGPFTVNDSSSVALTGETTDKTVYTQVDYTVRVFRGTTVAARIDFTIIYRNAAWELLFCGEYNNGTPSGMSFTVNTSTGQITATADTGAGNATLSIQKVLWAA